MLITFIRVYKKNLKVCITNNHTLYILTTIIKLIYIFKYFVYMYSIVNEPNIDFYLSPIVSVAVIILLFLVDKLLK